MSEDKPNIPWLMDEFRRFGYIVTATPIEGMEKEFAWGLWNALEKIRVHHGFECTRHNMRGMSKRALEYLHETLPNPGFGIEVYKGN